MPPVVSCNIYDISVMVKVKGTHGNVGNKKICDNCIHRFGGALKDMHSSPFVQHVICGISLQELHADRVIYQPRTPGKVVSKCIH